MDDVKIQAFFDEPTNTISYLVWNQATMRGVAIDPVLDFDTASGVVDDDLVNEMLEAAGRQGIAIEWVLETHVHADHLSGAPLIKKRTGARSRSANMSAMFKPSSAPSSAPTT